MDDEELIEVPETGQVEEPDKPSLTPVRIAMLKHGLALVQWQADDQLRRSWVKEDMLVGSTGTTAQVDRPERGMPYGVDFTQFIELRATPRAFDTALKNAGIWTIEDLLSHTQDVVGAVQSVYGVDAGVLMSNASRWKKAQSTAVQD